MDVWVNGNQAISWPILDIIIISIIAPSLVMILLYSLWRVRRRQLRNRERAPVSVVVTLPVRIYSKVEKQEDETCPICLDDFKDGDEIRILPCKHEYHSSCIDQWLTTRKRFCPLCKMDACPGAGSERSPLIIRNLGSSSGGNSSSAPNSRNPSSSPQTNNTDTVIAISTVAESADKSTAQVDTSASHTHSDDSDIERGSHEDDDERHLNPTTGTRQ